MNELEELEILAKAAGQELAKSVKKQMESLGGVPYGMVKLTPAERIAEHKMRYDNYGMDEWFAMFKQRKATGMRDYFKAMQKMVDTSLEVG